MTAAPTTIDFSQIRSALTGNVKYAPLGSDVPTDVSAAWDAAWIDLGTIDDKGVTSSHKKSLTAIKGWQSTMAVRQVKTEDEWTYKLSAIQLNWSTAQLWADADPVTTAAGVSTLTVAANAPLDEYMFGIEWRDGLYVYREFTMRGVFSDSADITLAKGTAVMAGLTYTTLPIDEDVKVITKLTNDPAFAAA